jgi:hypothetical protein
MLDVADKKAMKPERARAPDFNTMMHDLKGVSSMLSFIATSDDMKDNGGSDLMYWLSHWLRDFHDDMFFVLAEEDAKLGKGVIRG